MFLSPKQEQEAVLNINEGVGTVKVLDILRKEQPKAKTADSDIVLSINLNRIQYHPSISNNEMHRQSEAASRIYESHGASALDANEWRQILSTFDTKSVVLCKAISNLAVKIGDERLNGLDA